MDKIVPSRRYKWTKLCLAASAGGRSKQSVTALVLLVLRLVPANYPQQVVGAFPLRHPW